MKQPGLRLDPQLTLHQSAISRDSFDSLYKLYVDDVYRKCLTLTKNSETAQDYTQDIFLKVFTKLDTFKNQSAFSTWLYSVSHNYCLDQLRRKQRWISEPLSDTIGEEIVDSSHLVSIDMQLHTLERVMDQFSTGDITLLRLKYEEGLSIKEISQQYGLSPSALKMRLKRTRDKLCILYHEYDQ